MAESLEVALDKLTQNLKQPTQVLEMKKKGDDFFSESEKHSNDAWAIKETQEKIKSIKSIKK